jgi:predicted enzyme related to lactoylglutathione lyase
VPSGQFSRYVLRTTDVAGARAFYESVLGHCGDQVVALPEQARARGARPHWLGHLDVADPSGTAGSLLAAGGQQLGASEGVVVLRDPGGAIVALGGAGGASHAGVVWHVLRARHVEALSALYVELLGWSLGEPMESSTAERYRTLAWREGGPGVGVVGEISEGVHPHWLFFFGVQSLADAVARVRAQGGMVLQPSELPDGTLYAVCDDPQGAAFGLMQRPAAGS